MAVLQGRGAGGQRGAVQQADRLRLPGRPAAGGGPRQRPEDRCWWPAACATTSIWWRWSPRRCRPSRTSATTRYPSSGAPTAIWSPSTCWPPTARPERDIKGVNLDGQRPGRAGVQRVDAAFGGYEWFKVRDQGLAKVIYSTQGQDPAYTRQASLLVREEFERDNPAQVQKVVDVFVRALALGLGRGQSRRAVRSGKERRALRVLGRRVRQAGPGRAQLAADRRLHHRPLQGGGGRRAQAR